MVDAGFTTDTTVNLSQKCCWHLNKRDTTHPGSSGITSHIPYNTTTKSNNERASINSCGKKIIINGSESNCSCILHRQASLSVQPLKPAFPRESRTAAPYNAATVGFVTTAATPFRPDVTTTLAKRSKSATFDNDIIAVFGKIYVQHTHAENPFKRHRISAATSSTDFPSVSILISASA